MIRNGILKGSQDDYIYLEKEMKLRLLSDNFFQTFSENN